MPTRKRFRPKAPHTSPAPRPERPAGGSFWIYGHHTVTSALANPRRHVRRLLVADAERERIPAGRTAERTDPAALGALLPAGAVHQGLAALVDPLPMVDLGELLEDLPPPEPGQPAARLLLL